MFILLNIIILNYVKYKYLTYDLVLIMRKSKEQNKSHRMKILSIT